MTRRRRVLLGCNVPRATNAGAATTLLAEGAELTQLGWDVAFAFAPDDPVLSGRLDRQLAYVRVARAARRYNPDVAVISSADGALIPLVARQVPLVVQSHGLEHMNRETCLAAGVETDHFGWGHRHLREPAVKWAMRSAAAVAVKNAPEASYVIEMLGVPARQVHVIPNGIEPWFFERMRAPATTPTIVWIGSWLPRKGIATLPQVLESIVHEVPDAMLHLVGTGAPDADVRHSFSPMLQRNLHVTPDTDRAGVAKACSEAWVGLATSHFEGFGKMIIEMMAAGLPVVATPAGVAPDVVADDETGFLVNHDPHRISEAITRILRGGDDRRRMGSTARGVAQNFRWDEIGLRWNDLLNGILDERTAPPTQDRGGSR